MLQQPEGVLVEKAHSSILCPKKGRGIVFFFHPAHPLLPGYLLGLSNYWNVFLCQHDQAMEAHYNCDAFRSFPWVRVGRGGIHAFSIHIPEINMEDFFTCSNSHTIEHDEARGSDFVFLLLSWLLCCIMELFAAFKSAKCIEKTCLLLKSETSWGTLHRKAGRWLWPQMVYRRRSSHSLEKEDHWDSTITKHRG